MFEQDIVALAATAGAIGVVHTLVGPDHYIPFVMMHRARRWTKRRTAAITLLCGLGHVVSSLLLGALGIAFGFSLGRIERVEAFGGGLAAWGLIAFGLVYLAWGLRQAWRNKPHTHEHAHGHGLAHSHEHTHGREHMHVHDPAPGRSMTPWILFVLFVFGPCEALIPTLMYPAFESSAAGVILVASVFSAATLSTMLAMVGLLALGYDKIALGRFEKFGHAFAGGAMAFCGLAIVYLGV